MLSRMWMLDVHRDPLRFRYRLYGTALAEYERAQREGVDLLLDLDVQGAAQVRAILIIDAIALFASFRSTTLAHSSVALR